MTTCSHGYQILCPECPKEQAKADRERVKAGTWAYCVFVWRGYQGDYRATDAIGGKRYKSRAAAEKFAERENARASGRCPAGGYVVRFVPVPEGALTPSPAVPQRVAGVVEWFNDSKGYGFILAEGRKVFCHYTQIYGEGFKSLAEGEAVSLLVNESPKGPIATEIHRGDSI